MMVLVGLPEGEPAHAADASSSVEEWLTQTMKRIIGGGLVRPPTAMPKMDPLRPPPGVLRLTLEQAMALFLKQNLDLIIANYGIDAAKGRQITARLFPNPIVGVNTLSANTQGCTMDKCGAVGRTVTQLFEVAGKRGFLIRAAELDALSVEARFEGAVRQLGFTLKDSYFRVQRRRGHLAVDQEILEALVKLVQSLPEKGKRPGAEADRARLGLMTVNGESEVLQDMLILEERSGDLRMMLRLSPDVELELETDLAYRPMEPNLTSLLRYALENRPDIRALRLIRDKRKTELQLARVVPYPNVSASLGYAVQGPRGPDNQQQWALSFNAPLPVFNRNQGNIVEAEVAVKTAEADIEKTTVVIQNEVAVADRKFLHSRRLVEATQGVLQRASTLFRDSQQAYLRNDLGVVDLENTRRSYADTKENYVETVFGYQQSGLLLERAAGRDFAF